MLAVMKTRAGAAVILLVALLATGCSAEPTSQPAPTIAEAGGTSTPSPSPTVEAPATSDRGNLVKAVGDSFGLSGPDGASVATFVVTAINVDPTCPAEFAEPSEYGHLVRLDIEGETTAELPGDLFFAGGTWTAIAENGTTFNGDPWSYASVSCLTDAERFPSMVGPGERVAGAVILDVPTAHGIIVWEPEPGLSWEWTY